MKYYLFIITGPSGCGKTTLLKNLDKDFRHDSGRWVKAEKLSTRSPRKGEHDSGGYWDVNTPPITPEDTPEKIADKKKQMAIDIREKCDVIYYMNNELYGFNTRSICNQLTKEHVAIVLSDLGVIKTLKENSNLRDRIVTLYISSSVDSAQLTDVWLGRYQDFQGNKIGEKLDKTKTKDVAETLEEVKRNIEYLTELKDKIITDDSKGYDLFFKEFYPAIMNLYNCSYDLMPDGDSYKVRVDRLKNFYYKYIIDIGLFNHVILNYFDSTDKPENEQMSRQAASLIDYLEEQASKGTPITFDSESRPKDAIFFVCAAPKSGKRILQKNLTIMSGDQIHNVPKAALRESKGEYEKDNAMKAIITDENKSVHKPFLDEDKAAYDEYKENREACLKLIKEAPNKYMKHAYEAQLEEIEAAERKRWEEAKAHFPSQYRDWVWRFHGKYYGVNTGEISSYSKENREREGKPVIPVIMISNMNELDEAYKRYPRRLVPVFMTFVATDGANAKFHTQQVGEGKMYRTIEEAQATIEEIKAIKEAYYDNIGKFRHVLLNSGIEEDLHDQIINLVRLYHN